MSELVLRQFDAWEPGNIFRAAPEHGESENFSAPPFVSDEKDAVKLRALLSRVFDFKDFPKKRQVPVSELVLRQFEAWEPGNIFRAAPEHGESENFSAPPFVSDEKDAVELRALLSRVFDFKDFPKKRQVPVSELVLRQFDAWEPGNIFRAAGTWGIRKFLSPALVSDEKDAVYLRALLSRVFDFKDFPKRDRVPVSELVLRQFGRVGPVTFSGQCRNMGNQKISQPRPLSRMKRTQSTSPGVAVQSL